MDLFRKKDVKARARELTVKKKKNLNIKLCLNT